MSQKDKYLSRQSGELVPAEFARILLRIGSDFGIESSKLLTGIDLDAAELADTSATIPLFTYLRLLRRSANVMDGELSIGYEVGLRASLSTLPQLTHAALSQTNFGDAIRVGMQYSRMFMPVYRGSLTIEGDWAALDISVEGGVDETIYRHIYDMMLVGLWNGMVGVMGNNWPGVELWFSYPEPECFSQYAARLPTCHFNKARNQIKFPASQLGLQIQTGDPLVARLSADRLARNYVSLFEKPANDFVSTIKPSLARRDGGYPDLETIGKELSTSARTIKRRLQQAGSSFQELLNEVKREDALQMLSMTTMTVAEISNWMGYSDAASFTTAFRRWTGVTPAEWRRKNTAKEDLEKI